MYSLQRCTLCQQAEVLLEHVAHQSGILAKCLGSRHNNETFSDFTLFYWLLSQKRELLKTMFYAECNHTRSLMFMFYQLFEGRLVHVNNNQWLSQALGS